MSHRFAGLVSYPWQAAAAIRAAFADRANFALQMGGMVVNNGFFLVMWGLFFTGFHSIGGWRQADEALLLGMMMVVVGLAGGVFGGYRDMAAAIIRGEVDGLLTQPRSVLVRLLSRESLAPAFGDLATGLVVLAFFARLTWTQLPLVTLGIAAGLTIYVSVGVTFACLAFWARGARSLARDLVDFVILFSTYPGSIFSGLDRVIIYTVLPAGFIVLTPVELVRAPSLATLATVVAATTAYGVIALGLFSLGLARYRKGLAPVAGG
jgi:ABC-2 type transport system permease protein